MVMIASQNATHVWVPVSGNSCIGGGAGVDAADVVVSVAGRTLVGTAISGNDAAGVCSPRAARELELRRSRSQL